MLVMRPESRVASALWRSAGEMMLSEVVSTPKTSTGRWRTRRALTMVTSPGATQYLRVSREKLEGGSHTAGLPSEPVLPSSGFPAAAAAAAGLAAAASPAAAGALAAAESSSSSSPPRSTRSRWKMLLIGTSRLSRSACRKDVGVLSLARIQSRMDWPVTLSNFLAALSRATALSRMYPSRRTVVASTAPASVRRECSACRRRSASSSRSPERDTSSLARARLRVRRDARPLSSSSFVLTKVSTFWSSLSRAPTKRCAGSPDSSRAASRMFPVRDDDP
mmetsp:Transcript_2653/g.10527  ORF Transcript_2653/g.10527 Transcript_2653/m.10527 type:complete len:278 (+) Transcript_2653:3448-4281(+)